MSIATDATVHVIPAETNLSEDVDSIFNHLRKFSRDHRDVLVILGGIAVSQLVVRAMFRRELTRLRFNVEVFPFNHVTSTDFEYIDD